MILKRWLMVLFLKVTCFQADVSWGSYLLDWLPQVWRVGRSGGQEPELGTTGQTSIPCSGAAWGACFYL